VYTAVVLNQDCHKGCRDPKKVEKHWYTVSDSVVVELTVELSELRIKYIKCGMDVDLQSERTS